MKHTVIIDHRINIPKSMMSRKAMESRYHILHFDEKSCAKCDNIVDRPNELCDKCPSFLSDYVLYDDEGTKWSVPQGDWPALRKVLKKKGIDFSVVDKRIKVPFPVPVKFTGKLFPANYVDENGIPRANQVDAVDNWLDHGYGVLQSPPRSGKTVMATSIACELGQTTLIMAHQYELLKQFHNTIMKCTNIPALERKLGKSLVLLVNSLADLKKIKINQYAFVILNYQKLIHDYKRIAKFLNGHFGLLIVDECHNTAAIGYIRIAAGINVKYRLPLSATPKRKDYRHLLTNRIMGPVSTVVNSVSLLPRIELYQSSAMPKTSYSVWRHAMSWLTNSKERNMEIVKQVFKDLRSGHEVIIIPVDNLKHQRYLVNMINRAAAFLNDKKGDRWPENLAVAYNGAGGTKDKSREAVIKRVDSPGKTVLVPIRKMVREGIDFSRPSMMYIVIPMSAKDKEVGAPMFYQLSNRICTPADKPQPVVRIWVDNVSMFQMCLIGLFWNELAPNKYDGSSGRYMFQKNMYDQVRSILSNKAKLKNKLKSKKGKGVKAFW